MSVLVSWMEFLHKCSLCQEMKLDGDFLISGSRWDLFVCYPCNQYLNTIARKEEAHK